MEYMKKKNFIAHLMRIFIIIHYPNEQTQHSMPKHYFRNFFTLFDIPL